jgi:hypothetical protein
MMQRLISAAIGILAFAATPATAGNVQQAPPGDPYKKVSELAEWPEFMPGMGTLYVDPATLPDGPYLAYDHQSKLSSTIYMVPIKDFEWHKKISNLKAPGGNVDHVDIYYTAGDPGVPEPHYNIVLWHVPKAEESLVSR